MRISLLLLAMAGAATAGCVFPTGARRPFHLPCPPASVLAEPNLLERGVVVADVPLLPNEAAAPLPEPPPDAGAYRVLTAEECQCAAAAHAITAYLVDVERRLAIASTPRRSQSRLARGLRVHQQVLALRAAQIRNEAAGAALETYYRLAAAQASLDVIDRTRTHVRRMLGYLDELEQRGLPAPVDRSELRRQEIELLSRRAELEWSIARLDGQLRLAMGWELESRFRIWPQADLIVLREPVDPAGAVQTGLASRADLATLRLLAATLDEATLPLVRGALQTQDAALGNVTSGFERLGQLLRPARGEDELRARRAQLATLLAQKERELTAAIQATAGAVEMRRDQALLARRALEAARIRARELAQLRDAGRATPFEAAAQDGAVLEAEADLVETAAAWRLAEVQLRQTLGVLVWECPGHNPPG